MADPSPSPSTPTPTHTPMSQWLRPGNVAFVVGGVIGIVALASDLRSRAVKGLGIASAVVSILFGIHDRTRPEKLTWSALGGLLQQTCCEEYSAVVADARSAYNFAMDDYCVGPIHITRTFYLRYCGLCRAPEVSYPRSLPDPVDKQIAFAHYAWLALVQVWVVFFMLFYSNWLDLFPGLGVSLVVAIVLFFGLAVDLPLLVALFVVLRLCGRILCRLPFTKAVSRYSKDAGDTTVHAVRRGGFDFWLLNLLILSLLLSLWMVFLTVCTVMVGKGYEDDYFRLLGFVNLRFSSRPGKLSAHELLQHFTPSQNPLSCWLIASILVTPAPLGFILMATAWVSHIVYHVLADVWHFCKGQETTRPVAAPVDPSSAV